MFVNQDLDSMSQEIVRLSKLTLSRDRVSESPSSTDPLSRPLHPSGCEVAADNIKSTDRSMDVISFCDSGEDADSRVDADSRENADY